MVNLKLLYIMLDKLFFCELCVFCLKYIVHGIFKPRVISNSKVFPKHFIFHALLYDESDTVLEFICQLKLLMVEDG